MGKMVDQVQNFPAGEKFLHLLPFFKLTWLFLGKIFALVNARENFLHLIQNGLELML